MVTRRALLPAPLALGLAGFAPVQGRVFTPEEFGAAGDGVTNDSDAMARLAAAVNRDGGGTVVFRRTTYLVGQQRRGGAGGYLYGPAALLVFRGCDRPLTLRGNGARLRSAAGLRYGVFREGGAAMRTAMPYYGGGRASPYVGMIEVADCSGGVAIADLELAGSADTLLLGGAWGDTGWQIAGSGLILRDNSGPERIERVHSHHHPLDGIIIDGADRASGVERRFVDVRADANGRQGCSIVGGRGYRFSRCAFTRTGRSKIASAPGAGVDVEAENGKRIRDIAFDQCTFADNAGVGMVADSGDSGDLRFTGCTFIGTTSWSAWPRKPRTRFAGCTFVGALSNAFGDADPALATQFRDCTFTNDPARSPTRRVYGGSNPAQPLADLSDARNVLFDRCTFSARHGGVLPWSLGAIYRDCTMVQGRTAQGYPRGTFLGLNRITGNVDLAGSRFLGQTIVNGAAIRP